jgi:outer membrane protein TolC
MDYKESRPRNESKRANFYRSVVLLFFAMLCAVDLTGCANSPPQLKFSGIQASPVAPPRVQTFLASSAKESLDVNYSIEEYESSGFANLHRDPTCLPEQFFPITLDETLKLALNNSVVLRDLGGSLVSNPRAATTVYDPLLIDSDPVFGVQGTISEYDPQLFGQLTHSNNDRVFNNVTVGGGATELKQDLVNARAGVSRRTWSGASWELSLGTSHDANNRIGNLFPNHWEQTVEAGWRQPLLRGAGRQFNAISGPNARPGLAQSHGVWIAQVNSDISRAEFTKRLQQYLVDVEDAYWQLHLAYHRFQAIESSAKVAEEVYRIVQAKYRAGLEGGEADREAEARASMLRFRQSLQYSLGSNESGPPGVYTAELTLRRLIGVNEQPLLLLPVTPPPSAPFVYDPQFCIAHAMARRPELQQQRMLLRQEELKLLAAKNFLLPQLDLINRYRLRGFGDDLWGGGPRFSSAWQDASSMDHQEWEFGLETTRPVGLRQARQAVHAAQLGLTRAKAILREQQTTIALSVQEAIFRASSQYQSLILAEAVLEASGQRLAATRAQFASDRVPLDRVREAQEAWQNAAEQFEQARIDYARSIRNVPFQSGKYLGELSIRLLDEDL